MENRLLGRVLALPCPEKERTVLCKEFDLALLKTIFRIRSLVLHTNSAFPLVEVYSLAWFHNTYVKWSQPTPFLSRFHLQALFNLKNTLNTNTLVKGSIYLFFISWAINFIHHVIVFFFLFFGSTIKNTLLIENMSVKVSNKYFSILPSSHKEHAFTVC